MVCTECGKTYSDKMAFCPFCNAPKEESIELEIIDLDDVLEFEEIETEEANEQKELEETEEEELILELEEDEESETIELEIIEETEDKPVGKPEEKFKKEYKSFSDMDDLSSMDRVEIKIDRRQYKENELMLDTEDIKYYFKQDKRRIKIIVCLVLAMVGSFFNFWSIATTDDLYGNIQMGSLFAGYGLGGILGKICVLLIIVAIALIVINLTKYALWTTLAATFAMIIQMVVAFLSTMKDDFIYASVMEYLYPDLGFAIMLVFFVATIIMLLRSPEKIAQKRREAKENETAPEDLLKEALAEQAEDIQKQKEKMQAREDKRAQKELAKAAKQTAKLEKKNKKKNKNEDDTDVLELELVEDEEELQFEEIDDDIKSRKKSKKKKKG